MIIDITAGNEHCLALTETGDSVFAWGQGKYGALGTSKSQNFSTPTEIDKPDGLLVASILLDQDTLHLSQLSRTFTCLDSEPQVSLD